MRVTQEGEAFNEALLSQTRVTRLVRSLHLFDELDSTNRWIYTRAQEGAVEGTIAVADRQSAGRGRLGRVWTSPPGVNLYLSILLRPPLLYVRLPMLMFAAAVSAREAFLGFGLQAGIKWPNDILAGAPLRKLGGILAEARANGDRPEFVVLGMGMNLNLSEQDLPAELRAIATSYVIQTGQQVCRESFVMALLDRLDYWVERVYGGDDSGVFAAWSSGNLTLGRRVSIQSGDVLIEGDAVGIGPEGALLVQTLEGTRPVWSADLVTMV